MKIQYVIAIHFMRWQTNFYDFRVKWIATAAIGIHLTKAWLSQLVNFKSAIWTICNKILILNLEKCHRNVWNACMDQASVFEWNKRFKEGKESVRHDERCGRNKEVNTPELTGQRERVRITMLRFLREFRKRFLGKRPALFKSGQWHFLQNNAPVHISILVTDNLTKTGIMTVPHPANSPDLAPCDFWLFPKLTGRRYETIEEMKEACDEGHWQENFHGAFKTCWNCTRSALQPEEITLKGTKVLSVY